MTHTTEIKSELLRSDNGDAIVLFDYMIKHEPEKTNKWLKTSSTIDLKDACWRFRNFSMYRNVHNRPMPFDNDWIALDSAIIKAKGE